MQAAITIIVIAYNDEKHIGRALDSVVNQTMRDISVICVDDGSTDGTLNIMRSYEAKDERIRVVALEKNSGITGARYAGVMASDSKYLMFLDSDDTFVPEACEVLYQEMERRDCDILRFGVQLIPEGAGPSQQTLTFLTDYFDSYEEIEENVSGKDLLKLSLIQKKLTWNMADKCYKGELVHKIFEHYAGERIVMCEDMLFSAMSYLFCRGMEQIRNKLYCYRLGEGVSTDNERQGIHTKTDMETWAELYQIYPLLLKWLKEENYPLDTIKEELDYIKRENSFAILEKLVKYCIPQKRNEFLSYIAKYWPKEDFINEYIGYIFDNCQADPVEALDALKDSEYTKITRKEIKTVGMFYHRLANGGVERVMSLLAPIWERAGYQVVVITEQEETTDDYALPPNTKRVVLGEKFATNQARAKRFRQVIRDNHIDAMVYHAWAGQSIVQDSIVIRAEEIPLIIHIHGACDGMYRYTETFRVSQHKTYNLANVMITLSEADCAWWEALGHKTVQVINPATYDLREIEPAVLTSKNILCVSRLSEEKQFEDEFKIARLVHRKVPEAKLVFVGKSETEEQDEAIRQKLEQEGMSDYVCLEGFHHDVRPYYKKAAVFLSTSRTEGFPMSFIESKTFGLPMVAYDLTNIDTLRNPEGAIVVPQRDAYGAAEAIVRLLQDDELRRELGRQARQSVEKLYQEDLAVAWKNIFDLSLQPIEKKDKSPLETAIYRVVDTVYHRAAEEAKKETLYQAQLAQTQTQLAQLQRNCLQAQNATAEVANSTAYRVGRLITYIPRQAKDFVIICKGRGFSAGIAFIKEKLRTLPQVIKRF